MRLAIAALALAAPVRWRQALRTSRRAGAVAAALLASLGLAGAAVAQIAMPPRHDSQSPTGVSYRSLSFNLQERDLSIGGPGREGLALDRIYISNLLNNAYLFHPTQGWTHNFVSSVSNEVVPLPPDWDPWPQNGEKWSYHVNVGSKTYAFIGGAGYPNRGPWGPYESVAIDGVTLVYNGTDYSGYYTLTETDGSVINFTPGLGAAKVRDWTFPDGTRWDFTYNSSTPDLESVISNRGYALLFDGPNLACAVNMAETYVTATSPCPAGGQRVTYGYQPATFQPALQLLTSVTRAGATTTYVYSDADHLACVKDPGQSQCRISNTYAACPLTMFDPPTTKARRYKDPIVFQQTATGETYAYSTDLSPCDPVDPNQPPYPAWTGNETVMTARDGGTVKVSALPDGNVGRATDPLNRSSSIWYDGANSYYPMESGVVRRIIEPEGDAVEYLRDSRGNIVQSNRQAKPGSGLADIVATAGYPATCANPRTCNQPDWSRDAKGSQTDYVYAPEHGGVLSETGPAAANGVRPQTRYSYQQRRAWVKNASGGYSPASSQVWLLTGKSVCASGAALGQGCAVAGDEVITVYDYGPDSGPSNLLLRGEAVTAGGVTLRTCYAHDGQGNRISVTSPRAGLASCP
jgi:YD repeat-containing protein